MVSLAGALVPGFTSPQAALAVAGSKLWNAESHSRDRSFWVVVTGIYRVREGLAHLYTHRGVTYNDHRATSTALIAQIMPKLLETT